MLGWGGLAGARWGEGGPAGLAAGAGRAVASHRSGQAAAEQGSLTPWSASFGRVLAAAALEADSRRQRATELRQQPAVSKPCKDQGLQARTAITLDRGGWERSDGRRLAAGWGVGWADNRPQKLIQRRAGCQGGVTTWTGHGHSTQVRVQQGLLLHKYGLLAGIPGLHAARGAGFGVASLQ